MERKSEVGEQRGPLTLTGPQESLINVEHKQDGFEGTHNLARCTDLLRCHPAQCPNPNLNGPTSVPPLP